MCARRGLGARLKGGAEVWERSESEGLKETSERNCRHLTPSFTSTKFPVLACLFVCRCLSNIQGAPLGPRGHGHVGIIIYRKGQAYVTRLLLLLLLAVVVLLLLQSTPA